MRSPLIRTCSKAVLLASLICGCQTNRSNLPTEDPLLVSKKPVEGTVETAAKTYVTLAEPTAPTMPETSLAYSPGQPVPVTAPELGWLSRQPSATVQASPVLGQKAPVPASPASRSTQTVELGPPSFARPPLNSGTLGHAPNYAWLQGVLDRHYHGHVDLRYAEPGKEDAWGGKVLLVPESRLSEFKDGDVLYVEGVLIRPELGQGAWPQYPQYRVREARLVQRKN